MTSALYAADAETLANGVRFKSIPRDYTQTVSIVVFVKGGLHRETPETSGVGALFARTWLKSGTLLEKAEYVGGNTGAGLSGDYLEFNLSTPSAELDKLLPALRSQILEPAFSAEIFEREKKLSLQEIEAEKDDPNTIAFQMFMQATYRNHPYALRNDGDNASVSKLTLDKIREYYKNNFYGSDMIVAVAGKYSPEQLAAIKSIFAAVPKGKKLEIACGGAAIRQNTRTEGTDSRIQQAKLFVSYAAPAASAEGYVETKLLSDLLGGGMSSPYFTALRKEKGYAYSVGAMYPSTLCASRFTGYIGLQPENTEDAIKTMEALNKSILDNATKEDFEKSKNHIIGQILSEAETNGRTAWYAAFYENAGLGFEFLTKYVDILRKTELKDLRKVSWIFEGPQTIFTYNPAEKKEK
jgi:predicted Zn-dependent peptidase